MKLLDAMVDLAIVAFIFVVPMTAGFYSSRKYFSGNISLYHHKRRN